MKRAKGVVWLLLMLPGILFVTLFMLIPLCLLAVTTVSQNGSFSWEAYIAMFGSEYFRQVFVRSLRLSLLSTAVCAVLGFPTAYYIARFSKHKGMLMALAVFPMFTSPVIRSFSWMVILGKKGIINSLLVGSGLFAKPQSLLYNEFSMTVGFVQLFLPLMILSLIGVMDSIPDDLTLAACNLGATRLRAFFSVVFPLSISGLVTGSVLVFTGCLTAYTTPQLLGATDTRVLATVIYQYAMSLGDWVQAAVVAVIMIAVTVAVSMVFNAFSKKINPMV
ncbi:MAG: ABC transporter permease [Candidatus Fimivivens sp.]